MYLYVNNNRNICFIAQFYNSYMCQFWIAIGQYLWWLWLQDNTEHLGRCLCDVVDHFSDRPGHNFDLTEVLDWLSQLSGENSSLSQHIAKTTGVAGQQSHIHREHGVLETLHEEKALGNVSQQAVENHLVVTLPKDLPNTRVHGKIKRGKSHNTAAKTSH